MTLNERIKNIRIWRGLSQEELAIRMGYKSRGSINKIEMGKCDIALSKIIKFAKVLEVNPAYLTGWMGEDWTLEELDIIFGVHKLSTKNQAIVLKLVDLLLVSED